MRPPISAGVHHERQSIYVYTHDSIGLGEDGPTHQPIEQLTALRTIPNMSVLRPANPNEDGRSLARGDQASGRPGRDRADAAEAVVIDRAKFASAAGLHMAPTSWPTPPAGSRKSC